LLYLSLYFKANRDTYYHHLQDVRETGDWESWIKFFLNGVIETANQATETVQSILTLFNEDRNKIENSPKQTAAVQSVHAYLQQNPITPTSQIKKSCQLSLPTVLRVLSTLEELGIVREVTGKERHKIFIYQRYIEILNRGTEPLQH
jgi:Fic family protein